MIETVNLINSNTYSIPKGYKAIAKPVAVSGTSSAYVRSKENKQEHYDYKEEWLQNTKEKDWNMLKHKISIDKEEIYNLLQEGSDVEQLNPYTLQRKGKNSSTKDDVNRLVDTNRKEDEKNQNKLDVLDDKIKRLKEHTDNMYLYGITTKDDDISINSLYKGSYSGNYKPSGNQYTSQDIDHVLGLNNLDVTQGNKWAAGKLVQYDMPVTEDALVQMQNIKAAVESLDYYEENEKALQDVAQDETPGDRPLIQGKKVMYSEMDIQEIVDELSGVNEGVIEEAIDGGKDITIGNLKEIMHKNTTLALKANKSIGKLSSNEKVDQVISKTLAAAVNKEAEASNIYEKAETPRPTVEDVKTQINEIRAKLTAEAAQKISEKMPLESTELSKIASALRAQEETTITEALTQLEVPVTKDTVDTIKNVMEATKLMATHTPQAINLQIAVPETTLEEVHRVLGAYEEQETPVERRFGETIKKVESQIAEFLETQNIQPTKENIQAAKALITNDMEVTHENINEILPLVTKVNTFIDEMTPYRAAALIKEGVNPYKLSVENTLDWIAQTKVPELKGNIAEMIVALEDKGNITEDQKQGMLGFYRILHAVDKQKEDVIGYLFKNKSELTLEKLQEAAKYVGKKEHIEASIDDNFGELESIETKGNTAKHKIEVSQEITKQLIDATQLLEKMELPLTKENITSIHKLNAILYPFIKKHYKEEVGKFEGMDTLPPSLLEKIETIKQIKPEIVQFMEQQNIPITINHLYWMQKLIEDPNLYAKMLQDNKMLEEDMPKDLEKLEEKVKELLETSKETKENAMKNGDIGTYKNYKQLQEMAALQSDIMEREGAYQIPFVVNGEARLVHLYIKKHASTKQAEKEGVNAIIKYDTKHSGIITATINIKKDELQYSVKGETQEITDKLRGRGGELNRMLDEIGYLVTKETYEEVLIKENIILGMPSHKYEDSEFETVI